MSGGPLVPGFNEFDRPKRSFPRWAGFLIAGVVGVGVFLLIWGYAAGSGPFSSLGLVTEDLQPSGYRPTVDTNVIQVSAAPPQSGICPDQNLDVTVSESPSEIGLAVTLRGPRSSTCQGNAQSESIWIDVLLEEPLGDRDIVRTSDGQQILRTR
jgi:hypothetical protein